MYTLKTLSALYLQALQRFCFFSTVKVGSIFRKSQVVFELFF